MLSNTTSELGPKKKNTFSQSQTNYTTNCGAENKNKPIESGV